jgi:hypothetical protein
MNAKTDFLFHPKTLSKPLGLLLGLLLGVSLLWAGDKPWKAKTTSSGAPTVSADETEVQFSCKIADSTVRAGFRPPDMVDQSGPAL